MTADFIRVIVRIGLAVFVVVIIGLFLTTDVTALPQSTLNKQEASPTSVNCYQGGFDGQTFDPSHVLQPGTPATTTWRIVNVGSCVWTPDYSLVFIDGEKMSAPDAVVFGEEVQPGEIIEVTVPLIAPQSEGVHIGYWMIRDPNGTIFGVRSEANCAYFVSIYVSLDADATHPQTGADVPMRCLDINPNFTEEPPTPTSTLTEPPPTSTLTRTPLPTETCTPSPTATITQPDELEVSTRVRFPYEDQYRNIRFRDAGPLVPEFTTSIPSPLDVSLDPEVIGTNVLLATLLMIPFAYTNELLSRMLDEYVKQRTERRNVPERLTRLREWFNTNLTIDSKGRIVLRDKLRVLILILLYGLLFSLLDTAWRPFSKEGVLLFISMTITYGVVGMVDDFIQWRKIRKWNLPIHLKLSPTNLLLAIGSISISRSLFLVPGLMFGTPELLQVNEEYVSQKRQRQLLGISMFTFTLLGLVAWIPTMITRRILENTLVETGTNLIILGGVEALMLIIFAVTIENYFIQMLGFPGSFGRMFKRTNHTLWFVTLAAVTFIFIHTLINPRGDLMNALQKGNVIVFIGVVVTFVLSVLSAQAILWLRKRMKR